MAALIPKPAAELDFCDSYAPLWENRDVRYFIVNGGRGSGKSFGVAAHIADTMERESPHVTLYTRQTMTAADQSVIPEFMQKVDLMGYEGNYRTQKDNLIHENGNKILFRGIMSGSKNQTARLKSIPGLSLWIVDEAEEMNSEKDFDTINFSMRQAGIKNRLIICMNPCHVSHFIWQRFFKGKMPDGSDIPNEFNGVVGNVCYIHTTYLQNIENLDADFIREALTMKRTDYKKYCHLFLGHWVHELEGALWNAEMIKAAQEKGKQISQDDIEMVAVAVDPSVASADTDEQDEAGIVIVGKTWQGDFLVMDDVSGILSPADWGYKALKAFVDYDGDFIVAEINQGGDLVKMNLRSAADDDRFVKCYCDLDAYNCRCPNLIDKDMIPIETVRATKSKLLRADPVATLYKRGRVGHLSGLGKLEAELQGYTGAGELSPGRLDALVYAITMLAEKKIPKIRQG